MTFSGGSEGKHFLKSLTVNYFLLNYNNFGVLVIKVRMEGNNVLSNTLSLKVVAFVPNPKHYGGPPY